LARYLLRRLQNSTRLQSNAFEVADAFHRFETMHSYDHL